MAGRARVGNGPAEHRLDLGEMLVRNVPTDIKGRFGGPSEAHGNSIVVFEVEGLGIGHLGHLHHTPTPEQYASIGRLDVVMTPVDGGLTLPLPEMIALLKHVRSAIVIPMHWFSMGSLQLFLAGMEGQPAPSKTTRAWAPGATVLAISARCGSSLACCGFTSADIRNLTVPGLGSRIAAEEWRSCTGSWQVLASG